jgi:hypothetical protein
MVDAMVTIVSSTMPTRMENSQLHGLRFQMANPGTGVDWAPLPG